MVDTLVDGATDDAIENSDSLWGPYWINEQIGALCFIDVNNDLAVRRTTNGGTTWVKTVIHAGGVRHLAVWFDKETPGDVGTLLHMFYLDVAGGPGASIAGYRTFDIADSGLGTDRTISSTLDVSSVEQLNKSALTKTVNGNLLIAYFTLNDTAGAVHRSVDGGASWTARTDVFEGANDFALLFPADVDPGDVVCLFNPANDELTIKMYDDSENTWTEFGTVVMTVAHISGARRGYNAAVRHSDNHILVVGRNEDASATGDLKTADLTVNDITTPVISNATDVVTDANGGGTPGIMINQQNDDVYVGYLRGTFFSLVECFYQISTDDMATWDGEVAMSQDGQLDSRTSSAGRTVGDSGGRWQPSWFNDDDSDIFVNVSHDIEIAAVGAPVGVSSAMGVVVNVAPTEVVQY